MNFDDIDDGLRIISRLMPIEISDAENNFYGSIAAQIMMPTGKCYPLNDYLDSRNEIKYEFHTIYKFKKFRKQIYDLEDEEENLSRFIKNHK